MRFIVFALAALLLAGCNVVFIPVPVQVDGGLTLPHAVPAAAPTEDPTAEPTEQATDLPADVALFKERYAAFESTYKALSTQMESAAFDDAAWRDETVRLAVEWHDAIDVLQATACPEGDVWSDICPGIDSAMAHFGFAASDIENAARQNNMNYMATVRSQLLQGSTYLKDALAPLQ